MAPSFDRIARPYRWLEYFSFGPLLERCRFRRIPELGGARRALVLGDGDGRFLARLLAANPALRADVVDQSAAMLKLLEARVAAVGARERVRLHHADARVFEPAGSYDLVVTHFFLDCFTTEEVEEIAGRVGPHLEAGAVWVVSEFAVPRGLAALPGRGVIAGLYAAFRVMTGLRARKLPEYAMVLRGRGMVLEERESLLAGLLVSEVWRIANNWLNPL